MDRQIYELSREAHRDDCSREAYKMYYQALEAKIAWMEQEAFAASATIERLRDAMSKAETLMAEGNMNAGWRIILNTLEET